MGPPVNRIFLSNMLVRSREGSTIFFSAGHAVTRGRWARLGVTLFFFFLLIKRGCEASVMYEGF